MLRGSCCLFAFFLHAEAGWSPSRLRHVETLGESHLFRGSSPVANGTFVFNDLRATLTAAAANASITVPSQFVLIIITMLNDAKSSEKHELDAEKDFFAHLPPDALNGSRLVHWPIVGDVTSPNIYTKSLCHHRAKEYPKSHDRMPDKVQSMRDWMEGATQPTVVYFQ